MNEYDKYNINLKNQHILYFNKIKICSICKNDLKYELDLNNYDYYIRYSCNNKLCNLQIAHYLLPPIELEISFNDHVMIYDFKKRMSYINKNEVDLIPDLSDLSTLIKQIELYQFFS